MAGEIDFNGFRIDVYDKSTKKVLTDCVVTATYNGVNYSVPYVQSVGRYQLEVSSVPTTAIYTFEVTRDGYTNYSASSDTCTVAQAYISPKISALERCDKILASKAAIKAAIQEKGVSCDDTLAEYANRIKAIPTGVNWKTVRLNIITEPQDLAKNENGVFELDFVFQVYNEATDTWQEIPDNFAYDGALLDKDSFLSDLAHFIYGGQPFFENLSSLDNLEYISKDHEVAIIQYEGTFGNGEISGIIWKIPVILSLDGLKKIYGQIF